MQGYKDEPKEKIMATDQFGNPLSEEEERRLILEQQRMGLRPHPVRVKGASSPFSSAIQAPAPYTPSPTMDLPGGGLLPYYPTAGDVPNTASLDYDPTGGLAETDPNLQGITPTSTAALGYPGSGLLSYHGGSYQGGPVTTDRLFSDERPGRLARQFGPGGLNQGVTLKSSFPFFDRVKPTGIQPLIHGSRIHEIPSGSRIHAQPALAAEKSASLANRVMAGSYPNSPLAGRFRQEAAKGIESGMKPTWGKQALTGVGNVLRVANKFAGPLGFVTSMLTPSELGIPEDQDPVYGGTLTPSGMVIDGNRISTGISDPSDYAPGGMYSVDTFAPLLDAGIDATGEVRPGTTSPEKPSAVEPGMWGDVFDQPVYRGLGYGTMATEEFDSGPPEYGDDFYSGLDSETRAAIDSDMANVLDNDASLYAQLASDYNPTVSDANETFMGGLYRLGSGAMDLGEGVFNVANQAVDDFSEFGSTVGPLALKGASVISDLTDFNPALTTFKAGVTGGLKTGAKDLAKEFEWDMPDWAKKALELNEAEKLMGEVIYTGPETNPATDRPIFTANPNIKAEDAVAAFEEEQEAIAEMRRQEDAAIAQAAIAQAAAQAAQAPAQPSRGGGSAPAPALPAAVPSVAQITTPRTTAKAKAVQKRQQKKAATKKTTKSDRKPHVPNYVWVGGKEGGLVDLNNPGMGDVAGPDRWGGAEGGTAGERSGGMGGGRGGFAGPDRW